jgi:hypothetical protein
LFSVAIGPARLHSAFGNMSQRVYKVRPAVIAPVVLGLAAIILAVRHSWWVLVALPYIYLGSVCAQPNLNLANGCLAYVAMLIGFGTSAVFPPLGFAILGGAISGFYVSALEKWIRMCPVTDAELGAPPNGGPAEQLGNPGVGGGPPSVS